MTARGPSGGTPRAGEGSATGPAAATLRGNGDESVPRSTPAVAAGLAAVILCVYGGLALGVDFPRAAIGIQSDEATYYMMGRSLASDGDLTYRREDLVRVWEDFPSGPAGVFLKRGRDLVSAGVMLKPPFVWTESREDPHLDRYYYGKSFAYPLFAAPFVGLFGVNGFLVVNALFLALAAFCGCLFLQARTRPAVAAVLTGGFIMASVAPVYFVWIAPELMNFSLGLVAYFCWLYKEVAPPGRPRWGGGWLRTPASDLVAAALLGLLTFSKISNALLVPPLIAWQLWQRRWRTAALTTAAAAVVAIGLFGINMGISGEWNYQGGDRRTFVFEFPLQTPTSTIEVGTAKSRSEALTEIIFDRRVFWTNLRHNLGYAFVGRYAGLVPYFFPAVFALAAYLAGVRRRPLWQALALAGGLAQLLLFLIGTPYTWNGGGGSVGNRYFMGAYGAFLFLLPPIRSLAVAVVPWLVGSVFVAPLVFNPFVASFYPGRNAAHGPLRVFPPELTLVYDLPINTESSRVMRWFGDNPGVGDPGFQIYFFDANAYEPEEDKSFWVRGDARAEFLIKTDRPMRRLVMTLTAGPVATRARVTVDGRSQEVALAAGGSQRLSFLLDGGFPYQAIWPVWTASVSSSDGFVPLLLERDSADSRFLGVRVKPMLVER